MNKPEPLRRFLSVLALGAVTSALPFTASADTVLGIYAGVGAWQQSVGGDIAADSLIDVDVERDLDLDDDSNNVAYFALEHFVPGIPNVRLQYADISSTGANVLSRQIEFDGTVFNVNSDVATDLDLTQMDAALYYEVLDNWVSLDLGLMVRHVDGELVLVSATERAEAEFTGVLPMLYGRARFDLPFTGGWVAADVQGVAYNGNELIDASARAGWESPVGLGFEIGYRTWRLTLEDVDDVDNAEIDLSGPFAMVNFHF